MLYFTNNVLTHTQLSKWQCGGVTSEGEHSLVVFFFFSDDKGACPDSSVLNSAPTLWTTRKTATFTDIAHIEPDRVANRHGELIDQVNAL